MTEDVGACVLILRGDFAGVRTHYDCCGRSGRYIVVILERSAVEYVKGGICRGLAFWRAAVCQSSWLSGQAVVIDKIIIR